MNAQELLAAASQARSLAYAPYSGFAVGAAVRTGSGRIFTGANVENASYGLTMCAERAAIFTAVAAGERVIEAVAVVTDAADSTPPCGACRQVIWEFGPTAVVLSQGAGPTPRQWSIGELLPSAFGPASLAGQSRSEDAVS